MKHFIIILIFILSSSSIFGQREKRDSTKIVHIEHANKLTVKSEEGVFVKRLLGNVRLRQDSVWMYCDRATIIRNNVTAAGEVRIINSDSVKVFADSIQFEGDIRLAQLFGDVVLEDSSQQMFTEQLSYDLDKDLATYRTGALLTNGQSELSSKQGYYYTKTGDAFFKGNVEVVDSNFNLTADTLRFNTQNKVAYFLGPTRINQEGGYIYCEDGFYDTEDQYAEFEKNASFHKGNQHAYADRIRYDGKEGKTYLEGNAAMQEDGRKAFADKITYESETDQALLEGNAIVEDETQLIEAPVIRYDGKKKEYFTEGKTAIRDEKREIYADESFYDGSRDMTILKGNVSILEPTRTLFADQVEYDKEKGFGIATGQVVWADSTSNVTVECEHARYNDQTGYIKASGQPLMTTKVDEDFLYLTADTLISFKEENDSSRQMLAYANVKVFKSDLQAVCDSLTYSESRERFHFFKDPIIWSDTSQFSADTIIMQLDSSQIKKINLYNNSFIVNTTDEIFYNQIKGKYIDAFFTKNQIRQMDVTGNGESVYYLLDEKQAYIGVNKTICSEMLLYFGNNQVERIKFYTQPRANMYPIHQANKDEMKLKDFRWASDLRPMSVEDLIFNVPTND